MYKLSDFRKKTSRILNSTKMNIKPILFVILSGTFVQVRDDSYWKHLFSNLKVLGLLGIELLFFTSIRNVIFRRCDDDIEVSPHLMSPDLLASSPISSTSSRTLSLLQIQKRHRLVTQVQCSSVDSINLNQNQHSIQLVFFIKFHHFHKFFSNTFH